MKIGVVIPTRGDERKEFVTNCMDQLRRQTLQPNHVVLIDDKPKDAKPDITYRYRKGCNELISLGCDLIFFIEDDDFYCESYISFMVKCWQEAGEPDIFGFENTVYYNIVTQKYTILGHPGRASMMNTMVKTSALKNLTWCDDNYSYTDLHLWKSLKGNTKKINWFPCIGIKHGIGLCGGGGHVKDWRAYDKEDHNFEFLLRHVDQKSMSFYRLIYLKCNLSVQKYKHVSKPFLTIVTRFMYGKRGELFEQHRNSITSLNSDDFQQIYIIDNKKVGMLNANAAFQLAKKHIEGEYVLLLDDDDFITEPNIIDILKSYKQFDTMFIKAKILTGDGDEIYPKAQSWGSRKPMRGQIGGSCFIVKKEIYCKYIHHFALPSFGDWNFITEVLKDENITFALINKLMVETGKVSHGQE